MSSISRHTTVCAIAAAAALGASQVAAAQGSANSMAYASKLPPATAASKTAERAAHDAAHTAGAVWLAGSWSWQGKPMTAPNGGWAWVPGRWEDPPVAGATWTEGRWGYNRGWYTWLPAHWETPETRGTSKGS